MSPAADTPANRDPPAPARDGRAPVVVLLPGFDGTGALFAPLVAALPPGTETTTVSYGDLPDLADYIDHAEAAIPRDQPICLVAESFSGPIALQLLHRARRDYQCAVLSTTFAKPPLGLVLSLADKLRLASFVLPAVSEQILRVFCLNGVSDLSCIRATVDVVRELPQRLIQSRLRALTRMDASEWLTHIGVPVTVLSANQDRVIRQRYWQSLLQQLPDVRHQAIDGPHLLLQANPAECAATIADAMARA
jgi:pimeloyl-ACP methyl ester carboxylesterase